MSSNLLARLEHEDVALARLDRQRQPGHGGDLAGRRPGRVDDRAGLQPFAIVEQNGADPIALPLDAGDGSR